MPYSAPWSPVHDHLHQTIRKQQLLEPGQRLLIAVSGGQDSLCLAQLLVDLQPKWAWALAIAHCDHRWHADSTTAVQHVQRQAEIWRLPFWLKTAPDAVAHDQREATARSWRYQALTELAETQGYGCVVTGHTASDRAETLLHNLLRGSGLDGLQALSWRRSLTPDIQLVRPLLAMTRAETGEFCQRVSLPVWHDPSNQNLHYTRNRIRHEVLPLLRDRFNPNVESTLAQTAELMRADVDYLETEAEKICREVVLSGAGDGENHATLHWDSSQEKHLGEIVRLERHLLQNVPLALQRRVIRRCLLQLLPEAPRYRHIEKLVGLIDAPNKSQTDPLPGGAIACAEGRWIVIYNP
ncbi:MAG: tRNA lysidine(34) synthetase TilS [Elainellaceae cyanobacterium]